MPAGLINSDNQGPPVTLVDLFRFAKRKDLLAGVDVDQDGHWNIRYAPSVKTAPVQSTPRPPTRRVFSRCWGQWGVPGAGGRLFQAVVVPIRAGSSTSVDRSPLSLPRKSNLNRKARVNLSVCSKLPLAFGGYSLLEDPNASTMSSIVDDPSLRKVPLKTLKCTSP